MKIFFLEDVGMVLASRVHLQGMTVFILLAGKMQKQEPQCKWLRVTQPPLYIYLVYATFQLTSLMMLSTQLRLMHHPILHAYMH